MKKHKENISKAYALYTFIKMETDVKCGAAANTYSSSYPNLYTKIKVMNCLVAYAIKYYFDKDIQEKKPMKYLKNGMGFIEGIYFSIAVCTRVLCVCVSQSPIGVSIQLPCSIYDELDYVNHNFSKNEIEEYQKKDYGKETYFYILGKKRAYQIKNKLMNENFKMLDSTQEIYTFHKDTFSKENFIFCATGKVKFEKINDEEILS
ncbi:MAG: hypothetical protein NC310_07245 [Roseburia sp.]|nr:hypothetical protein [Anaeroplasma bactoclasticum]MCM1196844.1 hypothetical protein [Roseburia sp.]MCM1557042.1 hypothetical protein [Anaeroplasma bactoclasticum]